MNDIITEGCAGLDVHKKEVVACLRLAIRGKATYEVRRFPTTTRGLLELCGLAGAGRLRACGDGGDGCLLEAGLAHIGKAVPTGPSQCDAYQGCTRAKSDMNDATWIADLLAHGLIRASFVPPQPIQELRDLTRARKQLTREIVRSARTSTSS